MSNYFIFWPVSIEVGSHVFRRYMEINSGLFFTQLIFYNVVLRRSPLTQTSYTDILQSPAAHPLVFEQFGYQCSCEVTIYSPMSYRQGDKIAEYTIFSTSISFNFCKYNCPLRQPVPCINYILEQNLDTQFLCNSSSSDPIALFPLNSYFPWIIYVLTIIFKIMRTSISTT